MSADDLRRAITRIAHEIVERNHGLDDVVLLGLQRGGVGIARRLSEVLADVENRVVPVGVIDAGAHRDDREPSAVARTATDVPVDLSEKVVVLVDDVLFTGRTIRAALNALNDHGRARAVQLAVVVDRGHRELPIRPDFVGKNLPTSRAEQVRVELEEGVTIGELLP